MTKDAHGSRSPDGGTRCRVDIHIESKGDVHIHACCAEEKEPADTECPSDCPPPRTEGACIPLGLGCKPKQSRAQKLERLRSRSSVPSALAASFFQTARRHLAGASAANDFEAAVFPVFNGMSPSVRAVLACAVDSYETTPADLRDAGLEPSILTDPAKPVDTATLTAAVVREIRLRSAEAAFGDVTALEERPGRNRFFDPGGEFFEAQLQICRVNDLRTASYRPPIPLGDRLPGEIQQTCTLVLGPDGVIRQNCSVQTGDCPGNQLPDAVCARVPDVANGDSVMLSGVNFINLDIKVRLKARVGAGSAEVDAHVFGDLATPLNEVVNGQTVLIRDCRVKDQLSFVVPDDLPPGIYELQLAMPNTTGFPIFGPTVLSNTEFINIVPPATARFQIVAERLRARQETSPQSFGSDEVALTFLAAELLPDGSTGSLQKLTKRFGDVDSGENRTIEQPVFIQSQPALGMAMSVVGFEVDSERAFREQLNDFQDAFVDYLSRAWEKLKEALTAGAGAAIKALGFAKGAIAIAIAAVVGIAVIAVIARWAPADLIMDDAIGFSVIEFAELTNVEVPAGGITRHQSPQDLEVVVTPLDKIALTYREFREYVADDEDSRYEVYLRYNRIA
ncbi:hypothetical protein KXS07_13520 [Inquilinus limosus]|uniref:hypothetical protein n=1 Tax=Inquilinus limosus TaxID=171674 RepID=UPI003F163311